MTQPAIDISKLAATSYGVLKQTHDEYDGRTLEELEDLYVGGYRLLKKSTRYLTKLVNESDERYSERCKIVSYKPYFGQIVDQFVSDLFGQPLSVKAAADADDPSTPGDPPDVDYYAAIEKDLDQEGTTLVDMMGQCLTTALKKQRALLCVDAPTGDNALPQSQADEDASGVRRLYAYEVPVEQLIDWKTTPGGQQYLWAILNKTEQDRETPMSRRGLVKETFTVWTLGAQFAQWERYVITYTPDKPPKPEDPVPRVASGTSSFARIPLLRLELPFGLWVGNKVGPMAKEHWNRRSSLIGAENRTMVAIPVLKKGPQAPAAGGPIPADIVGNPARGNDPVRKFNAQGWIELGHEDVLEFVEPVGGCYELVDKQLDKLKEDMFAVNHQMAASIKPNSTALGRSGLSKQKDEDSTARVLRKLGVIVRDFATDLYNTIAVGRGEDVHWTVHGLDGYEHEDREQTLEEAVSLDQVQIPSVTFRKVHKRMVAEKLLRGIDPETLSTIIQEIEDGVDAEDDMRTLMQEAQTEDIQNRPPPDPVGSGVKMPSVKKPTPPSVGSK